MKRKIFNLILGQAFLCSMIACQSQKSNLTFENQGDSLTIVRITHPAKYLLLPIQEAASEGKVKLDTGSPADMAMDVRLAVDIMYHSNCLRELKKQQLLLVRFLLVLYAGKIFSCRIHSIQQIPIITVLFIITLLYMDG